MARRRYVTTGDDYKLSELVVDATGLAKREELVDAVNQFMAEHPTSVPSAAEVGADPSGTAADLMNAHEALPDPHSQYVLDNDQRLSDARTPTEHTHTLADVTDYTAPNLSGYVTDAELTAGLSGKASVTHGHAPADITGTAVITTDPRLTDARVPLAHQHSSTQITDWVEAVQDTVAAMLTSGANVTLSYDDASGTITVTAAGDDAELMRDTIGAALVGVNGVSVAVNDAADTITLSITGLSIAQVTGLQAALDGKQASGSYAAATHTHAMVDVTDYTPPDLSGYATTASLADVATSGSYADLTDKPTIPDSPDDIDAAAASHTHDDRYYTETEADARFVRTVNGVGPDALGDVIVAAGGGGSSAGEVRSAATSGYAYIGTATLGTLDTATGWTVSRIALTGTVGATLHASGAWTNRDSLVYS